MSGVNQCSPKRGHFEEHGWVVCNLKSPLFLWRRSDKNGTGNGVEAPGVRRDTTFIVLI